MTEYMKEGWENFFVSDILLIISTIALLRDFQHKDKIKKTPSPPKSTGEKKDSRPKVRGSIFKRPPPLPRR